MIERIKTLDELNSLKELSKSFDNDNITLVVIANILYVIYDGQIDVVVRDLPDTSDKTIMKVYKMAELLQHSYGVINSTYEHIEEIYKNKI
jgi:hypothetical protein